MAAPLKCNVAGCHFETEDWYKFKIHCALMGHVQRIK